MAGESVARRDDPALEGDKNDPIMPVSWTRTYTGDNGRRGRVFTTTMGAATDLEAEGTRRMLVNATYWLLGLEVPAAGTKVDLVGDYKPSGFGFKRGDYWKKRGLRPADFKMK